MLSFFLFPALAVLTIWILSRWASLKSLPLYVTVPVFISIFIPVSIIALVPLDLVDDNTVDHRIRFLMWRIIYWVSFALMWLILPVLQAYVESGYHAPLDRLKDALRYTLKYQLILVSAGLIGIIYVGITTGLSFTSLKALCVALSHSFGLVLVIWMLGHGCVEVPRSAWNGTVDARLSKLYRSATHVNDMYADAQTSYDDVVAKIMALEPIKTAKYTEWIDDLVLEIRSQDLPLSRAAALRAQPRDLTPENVASLSRRFHRDLSRTLRARADWMKLLQEAQKLEDLRETESSSMYVKVLAVNIRSAAVVCGILSCIVVWSELVSGSRLSLVDIIVRKAPATFKLVWAAVFLGYMCFCVNRSLFSMRIFNLYAIVPKHTDASSLLFFGAYALRLTVPLTYNFLMLNGTQETVFQEFLGKFINLTSVGMYFNQLLPRLIVLPIVMAMFNVYEIVKDYLGFGLGLDYFGDVDDVEGGGTVFSAETEGRELVRRALRSFDSNNSSSTAPTAPLENPNIGSGESEGLLDRFKGWFT